MSQIVERATDLPASVEAATHCGECAVCAGQSPARREEVFDRLQALLAGAGASFRVVEHPPEGRTEVVSQIRGNRLDQAAKALVLVARTGKKSRAYYLAVVPGDRRLNIGALKVLTGASFVGFADAARAEELTGCAAGSIPPFSFHPELSLVVDPELLGHAEIVFNAGRLDRSIFLDTRAYVELARPTVHAIADLGAQ